MVNRRLEIQLKCDSMQRFVCQGQVAEVGTAQVIQQRVNDFLDGTYTPFSRKRPASPLPPSVL